MADHLDHHAVQPKQHHRAGISLEAKARQILRKILPRSIKEGAEIGAMIYRNNHTGMLGCFGPVTHTGDDDLSLHFPLDMPNHGCPEGTTLVALVHTHPRKGDLGWLRIIPNRFSPDDIWTSDDNQIVNFVGTIDGTFLRYDPPKLSIRIIDGMAATEVKTDKKGNIIHGKTTVLNGNLLTR